ncbi:hypothetical protein CsatA_021998 [Cannabis sativa]
MADRQNQTTTTPSSLLRKLQIHAPNSTQLLGILTLIVSGSIFLFLTGATVTVTILALILFSPLIILTIPIWVPIGCFLIAITAAFLSFCGFGVAAVAVAAWVYKYFRGLHPPGSDRVDYARSRIYDTASHVKDYAREYGGYLQSKAKDAAPGA